MVTTCLASRISDAKRGEIIKKVGNLRPSSPSSSASAPSRIKTLIRKRTNTSATIKRILHSSDRKAASDSLVDSETEENVIVGELRTCKLVKHAVQISSAGSLSSSSEEAGLSMSSSSQLPVDLEIKLFGMKMQVHVEHLLLELAPGKRQAGVFPGMRRCEPVGGMERRHFQLPASSSVHRRQLARKTSAHSSVFPPLRLPNKLRLLSRASDSSPFRPSPQLLWSPLLLLPPPTASIFAPLLLLSLSSAAPSIVVSSTEDDAPPREDSREALFTPRSMSGYRDMHSVSDMMAAAQYGASPADFLSLQQKYGVTPGTVSTGYGMSLPHDDSAVMVDAMGNEEGKMPASAKTLLTELSSSSSCDDLSDSRARAQHRDRPASTRKKGTAGGRDDFNEIFQRCVTKLRHSEDAVPSEENDKIRLETYVELIGLAEDFVTSAVRYGQIIISEVYLPLSRKTIRPDTSVGGVIGGEKFIVHNIMFKFALDSHNVFGGNDESAAKVAGLEQKGLQAYMSSNTPDLCYPLMALIDYKGFRLVASSLLPLTETSLVYGSQDAAVTVKRDNPALTQRIEEASAKLNLKRHEAGKDRVIMASAVDIEGHLGSDQRFYLLDFSRVFPCVTPNRTVEGSHLFQMFRPEFVKSFSLFPLCSDAYSNFTAGLPDAKEHAEEVDLATMELLNVSVSNFVAELIARMGEEARIAGNLENFALTQLLHSHGINVRYLGEVVRKMGRHPFGLVVLTQMVARVVKIGFRKTLRAEMKRLKVSIDEPYRIAAKDFLNLVFSSSPQSEIYWSDEVPRLLNQRFQLRPGNWNAFPKNLRKTLFDVEKVNGVAFNAKVVLFFQVQQALGLKVALPLVSLLQTQPKVYAQKAVFDDVDVEDVGLRVKFLDVISNAQGYVFSKRAEEKEKEGFFEAAKSLYARAYSGYQAALGSCPNDSVLLRNCATVMTKLYRLEYMINNADTSLASSAALPNPDADNPLLFGAQLNFKKAIQANRKSPLFYASYADFLRSIGSYEDAEAHYLESLLRDPFSIPTLWNYSKLLLMMGEQNAEAAEQFAARARVLERNEVTASHETANFL